MRIVKISIHGGYTMVRIAVVGAFFLCFACAHVEPPREAAKLVKQVDIQSPVIAQVEKVKRVETQAPKEVFSFSLREADLKDVLRGIAKQTNYNVVMEPDVKGTSTVDLKNVTIDRALEYILSPLNYTHRIDENTIYVSRPKLETRLFQLNYAAFSKVTDSIVTGSSGTQRSGTNVVGVTMRTRTDMDAWQGFQDTLKGMLSPEGRLTVNRQSGLVSVRDYRKNIKDIALLIKSMEGSVQRQVQIEARVVEVQLNNGQREGVNWQLINAKLMDYSINFRQQLVDPFASLASGAQFARLFVGSKHLNIDQTFIELLKTQGKLNFLSNPKINTLNNQRAVIKVATDDAVFESTTTISTGGTPTTSSTIKYITIGLILDVVPYIDDQGNIIMNIHPMLTERTGIDRVDKSTGNSVPVLNVREVDTTVRVKEGEMIIIGGLIREAKNEQVAGIPAISNVPLLGWPFRYWSTASERTELVIFLTPRVVYTEEPA
jgi:MSHA biogenesis protein MshL